MGHVVFCTLSLDEISCVGVALFKTNILNETLNGKYVCGQIVSINIITGTLKFKLTCHNL